MSLLLATASAVTTAAPAAARAASIAVDASSSVVPTAGEITSDVASFVTTTVPSIVASILPSGYTTTSELQLAQPLQIMSTQFEIAATAVGAVSGALIAVRKPRRTCWRTVLASMVVDHLTIGS